MSRATYFSMILSGLLATGALSRQEATAQRPDKIAYRMKENKGDIQKVADDQIDAYATRVAEKIVAAYHENAKTGKHTVAVMGEVHTISTHHLVQILIHEKIIAALGPEHIIHTLEDENEKETELGELSDLLDKHKRKPLARVAEESPLANRGFARSRRAINVGQSMRNGVRVRYIDADMDDTKFFHIDSLQAARTEETELYQSLDIPKWQRGWRNHSDRRKYNYPEAMVIREVISAGYILDMLDHECEPALVLHTAGRKHIVDNNVPDRMTLSMILEKQENLDVLSFPMIVTGFEQPYVDGARVSKQLRQNFPAIFNTRLEDTQGTSTKDEWSAWDKLCDLNNAKKFKHD